MKVKLRVAIVERQPAEYFASENKYILRFVNCALTGSFGSDGLGKTSRVSALACFRLHSIRKATQMGAYLARQFFGTGFLAFEEVRV